MSQIQRRSLLYSNDQCQACNEWRELLQQNIQDLITWQTAGALTCRKWPWDSLSSCNEISKQILYWHNRLELGMSSVNCQARFIWIFSIRVRRQSSQHSGEMLQTSSSFQRENLNIQRWSKNSELGQKNRGKRSLDDYSAWKNKTVKQRPSRRSQLGHHQEN